jgi:uncharacterized membrane protein
LDIVDLLARWLHVGSAIVLVGGAAFMRIALLPAANQLPQEQHDQLKQAIVGRWKRVVHIGILLLLLTGLYNWLVRAEPAESFRKSYQMLMGIKFLLALVVFGIASVLVGRSAAAQRIRQNPKRALGLMLLIALVIVCISGYLRVAGTKAIKAAVATPAVTATAN